jgi:hypothetical protein
MISPFTVAQTTFTAGIFLSNSQKLSQDLFCFDLEYEQFLVDIVFFIYNRIKISIEITK